MKLSAILIPSAALFLFIALTVSINIARHQAADIQIHPTLTFLCNDGVRTTTYIVDASANAVFRNDERLTTDTPGSSVMKRQAAHFVWKENKIQIMHNTDGKNQLLLLQPKGQLAIAITPATGQRWSAPCSVTGELEPIKAFVPVDTQ